VKPFGRVVSSGPQWRFPALIVAFVVLIGGVWVLRSGGGSESLTGTGTGVTLSPGADDPFADDDPTNEIVTFPEGGDGSGGSSGTGGGSGGSNGSNGGSNGGSPDASLGNGANGPDGSPLVGSIYLDGWTQRIIGNAAVTISDSSGRSATLTFDPLDEREIDAVSRTAPQLVADAFSRLVTPDEAVRCERGSCRSKNRSLGDRELADLTTVDALSSMYSAWGIRGGLLRAQVRLSGSAPYIVTIDGYGAIALSDPRSTNYAGDDRDGAAIEPGRDGGHGNGNWYIGAAFGTTFLVAPDWGAVSSPATYRLPDVTVAEDLSALDPLKSAPLQTGLADRSLAARVETLTAGQLTYLSSPTSGCSPAVTCVPARVVATVSNEQVRRIDACDGQRPVLMSVYTLRVRLSIPQRSMIPGANGATAENSSLLGWTNRPPLASGTFDSNQLVVAVTDTFGRLVAVAGGRTASSGTFDVDLTDPAVFFKGRYRTCG